MLQPFGEAEADRLIRLYAQAEKELGHEIEQALLRHDPAEDIQALKNLRTRAAAIRVDLLVGGRTWCTDVLPPLWAEGGRTIGPIMSPEWKQINQRAFKVLADNSYSRLQDIDQLIGRRVDDLYRSLALESARGQLAGYRSWDAMAEVYHARLAEHGVTGFVDSLGREWSISRYAEMVARTTAREALLQGSINRMIEYNYDLVRISTVGGDRVCEKCRRWEGSVLSLTGKTKGYPTLADARASGLLHPNCRHNIYMA